MNSVFGGGGGGGGKGKKNISFGKKHISDCSEDGLGKDITGCPDLSQDFPLLAQFYWTSLSPGEYH